MLANRSMPACPLIPTLVYDDTAQASRWLCDTFGFTERLHAGNHHELCVGDGVIFLTERRRGQGFQSPDTAELRPPHSQEVTHILLVRVEDVERHHAHTKQHHARILNPPTDCSFGERQYTVEDLGGHRWTFSQSISDVAPQDWNAMLGATE